MRIAVGQLWQETNTFNRNATEWTDFEAMGIAQGEEVVERFGATGELSGFLAEFKKAQPKAEYVGLARFACWPWGAVEKATWKKIKEAFVTQLKAAGTVDAVYLTLHGAVCSQDEPDLTGALLELVRKHVGPKVPIVGSLDLHANITKKMIDNADALAGYHACPHIDGVETGARAAKALLWQLESKQKPKTYIRKLPMITAAESHNTFTGLPSGLYTRLKQLEREKDVLTAGLYMAMPWFDCPDLGWTFTLTTKGETDRYTELLDTLAEDAWDLRHEMERVERVAPADIVKEALRVGGKPVVIGDGADATNSGAPGDSTVLLKEFLKQPIPNGALTFIVDPNAVAEAYAVGLERPFDAYVGGKLSEYSAPLRVQGRVTKLFDVKWVLSGHICNNLPIDMGRGAIVKSGDVTILFCERSGPGSSPKLYQCAGLDPKLFKIVVAKSPAGFRADYGPFAAEILLADCPGCAAPHWKSLKFEHVNRPLFPLDDLHRANANWCWKR